MNEESLKFSFDVMTQKHNCSNLLAGCQSLLRVVKLFAENQQQGCYENWTTIFNQEDSFPADLSSQVTQSENNFVRADIV